MLELDRPFAVFEHAVALWSGRTIEKISLRTKGIVPCQVSYYPWIHGEQKVNMDQHSYISPIQ